MDNCEKIEIFYKVLSKISVFLNRSHVVYAFLPDRSIEDMLGRDVDVYVKNISKFTYALNNYTENDSSVEIVWLKDHASGRRFNLVCRNRDGEYAVLPGPDLVTFSSIKNTELIDLSKCLERSIENDNGIKFFQRDDAFLLYLAKCVDKRCLNLTGKKYLLHLYQQEGLKIENKLCIVFGSKITDLVLQEIVDDEDCSENLMEMLNEVFISGKNTAKRQKYYWDFSRFIKRLIFPSGLFVAFLGPDGAGKTSVINGSTPNILKMLTSNKQSVFHLRPNIGSRTKTKGNPVSDPHAENERSYIVSAIKIIYFLFDYVFGYILKIRPMLMRSTLVVFDRYYHDLFVDPVRYRYSASRSFLRSVEIFIPKPDLIFFLDAPAEILQARKQEVSFSETARQRTQYLLLASNMRNSVVIDASKPLKDVIVEIETSVVNYLVKRTGKRLGF